MTAPTDAEAKAFRAAVEALGLEADSMLEHLPPPDVVAALCSVAVEVAADCRVGTSVLIRIFSRAVDGRRRDDGERSN